MFIIVAEQLKSLSGLSRQAAKQLLSCSITVLFLVSVSGAAVAQQLLPQQFNPYDQQQMNPLIEEGLILQEEGDHEAAVQLFQQAWEVSRINEGLYSETQLPLIERIIQSEIELADWDAVDARYAYMEHLMRRLYSIDDPQLEAGLQKVASWHIVAFNSRLTDKPRQHLRRVREINLLRLDMAELTLPENDPKFDLLKESIAISESHLYRMSDMAKEQQRAERSLLFDRAIADLN